MDILIYILVIFAYLHIVYLIFQQNKLFCKNQHLLEEVTKIFLNQLKNTLKYLMSKMLINYLNDKKSNR